MSIRALFVSMTVLILLALAYNVALDFQNDAARPRAKTVAPESEAQRVAAEIHASAKRFETAEQEVRRKLQAEEAHWALEDRVAIPLDLAFDLRDPVISHYLDFHAWPERIEQIDAKPWLWNETKDTYALGAAGRIRVEFSEPFQRGTSLTLTPRIERGSILWSCSVMGDARFETLVREYLALKQLVCPLT